jgi:hypothetical protein
MGMLMRESLAAYRGSLFEGLRLEVDDVFSPQEPLDVGVATDGPAVSVAVAVENVDTSRRVEGAADLDGNGRATATISSLEAGVYRVTARDPDESGIKPVTDLVVVGDDASVGRAAA